MINRCPVSLIDMEWIEVINIINMCGGEFGMNTLPSRIMEETAFYFEVRSVINGAKHQIEQYKSENKEG